jgi:molybdopterin converting factor small subunit
MSEIVVKIPAALQSFAGDQRELRTAPGTVAEVLQRLAVAHPQLVQRLLTAEGDLRPFVNVFVGRVNVRDLRGLATRVIDGEVMTILPAVAGG